MELAKKVASFVIFGLGIDSVRLKVVLIPALNVDELTVSILLEASWPPKTAPNRSERSHPHQ